MITYLEDTLCPECDGSGRKLLWVGHGGNEHINGETEVCWFCHGTGEVNTNDL